MELGSLVTIFKVPLPYFRSLHPCSRLCNYLLIEIHILLGRRVPTEVNLHCFSYHILPPFRVLRIVVQSPVQCPVQSLPTDHKHSLSYRTSEVQFELANGCIWGLSGGFDPCVGILSLNKSTLNWCKWLVGQVEKPSKTIHLLSLLLPICKIRIVWNGFCMRHRVASSV